MSEPVDVAPDPSGLGERFLAAFNDIESRVRRDGSRKHSFGELSRAFLARRGLSQHADALSDFTELRNTLAHGRHFRSGLLATPAPEVVAAVERLRDLVVAPPPALDALGVRDVVTCGPRDEIGDVLAVVAELGYSVVPALDGGRVVGAVTSHALARWLADAWTRRGGPQQGVPVAEVMAFARPGELPVVLGTDASVADVVAALGGSVDAVSGAPAAAAVLLVPSPPDASAPTSIATPGDLPALTRALALHAD